MSVASNVQFVYELFDRRLKEGVIKAYDIVVKQDGSVDVTYFPVVQTVEYIKVEFSISNQEDLNAAIKRSMENHKETLSQLKD